MNSWARHLPVLPIVLPLITGALLLLLAETRRIPRLALTLTSTLAQLAAAATMVWITSDLVPGIWSEGIGVYAIGSFVVGLILGALNPKMPLQRQLLIAVSVLALTALPLLVANTSVALLAFAVFLSGVAISPIFITSFGLIERRVPESMLTEGVTWVMTGIGIGMALGAFVTGWVVDNFGAQNGFWVSIAAAGAAGIGLDQHALDRRGGEPLVPEADQDLAQMRVQVAGELAHRLAARALGPVHVDRQAQDHGGHPVGGDQVGELGGIGGELGPADGLARGRDPAAGIGNGDADGLGPKIEAHEPPERRQKRAQFRDIADDHPGC